MIDIALLSLFFISGAVCWGLTLWEILVQFLVPFNLTCGIFLTILRSRRLNSENFAVGLCLLWAAVWQLVILNEHIYRVISIPIWCAVFALSAAYLVFGALKVIKSAAFYCEVEPLRN